MIVTDLEELTQQAAESDALTAAVAFLCDARDADLENGRVDIDGDRVYAIVQSYETKTAADGPVLEAHRRFLDVQYMVQGTETMGWAPLEHVSVTEAYDEEKDCLLGTAPESQLTRIPFSAGQVMVLYPSDAHAPGLAAGEPAQVKKIVVKIAV